MKNTVKVKVTIGKTTREVEYDIDNWSKTDAELEAVFGSRDDIREKFQEMQTWHGPHGTVRRRVRDKAFELAKPFHKPEMVKKEIKREDGSVLVTEVETDASKKRWEALAEKKIDDAIQVLGRLTMSFNRGSKEPTQEDYATAEGAIKLLAADAKLYAGYVKKAATYGVKLPETPTVDSLAAYLRAKTLAEKDNPLARLG